MKTFTNRIGLLVAAAVLVVVLAGCSGIIRRNAQALDTIETVAVERGPLTVMIGAIGSVRSAQTATLSWQTSGTVGSVTAALKQKVTRGESMASLDPTSLSQGILQAQVDLINARSSLESLKQPDPLKIAQAQETLEQAQTQLDNLLNPSAVVLAEAEISVLNAQDALEDAQNQVNRLAFGRGGQEQVELARANYLLALEKVDQMQARYDQTPGSPDRDPAKAMALSSLAGAQNERDRTLAAINWYLGGYTSTEVAEKEADLSLAQARLENSQRTLAELQNPTSATLALAQARVTDAQKALDEQLGGPSEDDLLIAQTRVTQAEAALAAAGLVAPFDGTITQVMVLQGDLVSPGSPAFRIDDLSTLYVDLEVSEVDISVVQPGQPVSITFDAILDQSYEGEVTQIGQIGTISQGTVSFSVTVRMLNPGPMVRSGMTAIANITVAQAEDILQLPSTVIQEDEGKRYVYLLPEGGSPADARQVYVQVGLTSDTSSEVISSELKEGDRVLVSAPDLFMMRGGGQP